MGVEELNPLDNEESGTKAAEVSDKVFRDQQSKTKKTIKELKKIESSARQKDGRLAQIIGQFLQTRKNSAIMILITRCLDRNIPAGLILGLLTLVELEARKEFELLLGESVQLLSTSSKSQINSKTVTEAGLPPYIRQTIDTWSHGLLEFGLTQPTRLLATAASPEGKIFPSLIQLTTFILREYLEREKVTFNFDNLHKFAELILKNTLAEIRTQVAEIKTISST